MDNVLVGVSGGVTPGQGPYDTYGDHATLSCVVLYEEEPGMLLRGHLCGVASDLGRKETQRGSQPAPLSSPACGSPLRKGFSHSVFVLIHKVKPELLVSPGC